jgi:hypothetical protein
MTNIGKIILFSDKHCGMPHSYFDVEKFVQHTLSYQYYKPQSQLLSYFITYLATQTVLAYSIDGKSKKVQSNSVPAKLRVGTEISFASLIEAAPQKSKSKLLGCYQVIVTQSVCDHGSVVGRLEMGVKSTIKNQVARTGNS